MHTKHSLFLPEQIMDQIIPKQDETGEKTSNNQPEEDMGHIPGDQSTRSKGVLQFLTLALLSSSHISLYVILCMSMYVTANMLIVIMIITNPKQERVFCLQSRVQTEI